MTIQRKLTGGGLLTMEEYGGSVYFEVSRPQDGRGLYKAWIFGTGGRMLLGTLIPQGGELRLGRQLTRSSLLSCGCYPVTGGEVVMAFPFHGEKETLPQGWIPMKGCAIEDDLLRQSMEGYTFLQKEEEHGFLLATIYDDKKEMPLAPLFCLAVYEKLGGKNYLVWKFDEKGRPIP